MTASNPVELLQSLIRCASVTPVSAGVLDVVEEALAPFGFTVERVTFEGDGSYPVENLFASRGSGGKHLLFNGHTDVVPPGDATAWRHLPFAADIVDGHIFGRGSADMKSGVAAFITACATAVANGSADHGTISLAITNDEEADGINGTEKLLRWAADRGHRFDFAIVGEPSATARVGDSIKIGRRGSLNGRITVTGTQGHVAYPQRANNPLPVMAAVVSALNGPVDEGSEHFPPTNLEFTSIDVGNETTNVIPAKALARFNVRFNDRWTPETLVEWVRARIAAVNARGCTVAFEPVGRASRSFLAPTGGPVAALCDTIARLTGAAPELSTAGGTSDARFVTDYCPVVECGLPGQTMHQVDENVLTADVEALASLYAAFISDYLK